MLDYFKRTISLSWSLAKANFKLRTEGSYLGILWYLLDPILLFSILYIVFGHNLGAQIKQYPLYLILGIIMFNFFTAVTTQAASAITSNGLFIKSMKINIESLVVANLFQSGLSHFFEVIIFAVLLIYFKISLIGLLIYLLVFLFFSVFILGVSFLLATIGVYATDLNNVWKFFTQVLFFATPIFYLPTESFLLRLNPVGIYMTISRDLVIYNRFPDTYQISLALIYSFACLLVGSFVFKSYKKKFAENL